MKILIFGANGMAGHMTAVYLMEKGHDVTGFVRTSNNFCKCVIGNAMNQEEVKSAIAKEPFDIVINCIGVLNKAVDASLAEGIYLNSVFPHFLAECLKKKNARLIHISSDCVFMGDKGSYREDSNPDADSYYGKTKALGEINDNKNLTFRTSIIGPELKDGTGLFHWFMAQGKSVNGFSEVIWTGVTTLELAKAIEAAIELKITGLYQLVNNKTISKYDLLGLFNQYMNEGRTVIHQNGSFFSDKSLVNTRTDFNYTVPLYEQMIRELADWMNDHAELYQQYKIG